MHGQLMTSQVQSDCFLLSHLRNAREGKKKKKRAPPHGDCHSGHLLCMPMYIPGRSKPLIPNPLPDL